MSAENPVANEAAGLKVELTGVVTYLERGYQRLIAGRAGTGWSCAGDFKLPVPEAILMELQRRSGGPQPPLIKITIEVLADGHQTNEESRKA